jgi:hypothetical protein
MTQKTISLLLACLFGVGIFTYTNGWFSENAASVSGGFPGGPGRGFGSGSETQVILFVMRAECLFNDQ